MPTPSPSTGFPTSAGRPNVSLHLWDAVVRARSVVDRQRQLPQSSSTPMARVELLEALEAYVADLDAQGRPIPYAMRDELRLQQLTCPPGLRRRPTLGRGTS